ncbi:signal peptide peptidase SppA, 36K type, partial [mine drainage metagenome]
TTLAREHRSAGWWAVIKRTAFAAFFIIGVVIYLYFYGKILGVRPQMVKPTVAVIDIDGGIGPGHLASASNLVPEIDNLCGQREVEAVIVHIDSPGGSPTDAERIGAALDRCKRMPAPKEATAAQRAHPAARPVIAVIDGLGASAAYMIAIHANKIYASRESLVGSIGIIIEGFKFNQLLAKVGVNSYAYTSGPLKAALSPWQADSPAEKALVQQLTNDAFKVFQQDVEARRPHLVLSTTGVVVRTRLAGVGKPNRSV